jgi:hypothetical protein
MNTSSLEGKDAVDAMIHRAIARKDATRRSRPLADVYP